jgi:hypothetical protein
VRTTDGGRPHRPGGSSVLAGTFGPYRRDATPPPGSRPGGSVWAGLLSPARWDPQLDLRARQRGVGIDHPHTAGVNRGRSIGRCGIETLDPVAPSDRRCRRELGQQPGYDQVVGAGLIAVPACIDPDPPSNAGLLPTRPPPPENVAESKCSPMVCPFRVDGAAGVQRQAQAATAWPRARHQPWKTAQADLARAGSAGRVR